jgi:rubredoxin
MKECTCINCGWVHKEVSLEYAENEVARFNEYYDILTPKEQQDYYGGHRSSMDRYTRCFSCGESYKNFRDYREGDCPVGVTIGPILDRHVEYE